MNDETIVAVYDTPAHAELAIQDIIASGVVPESAVSRHGGTLSGASTTTTIEPVREQGFWASLFGSEPDHDTAVYDRSLERGSTVVTVRTPESHVDRVMEILEGHLPIDIDARAAEYGLTQTTEMREPAAPTRPEVGATVPATATAGETMQLAEESLTVGKRVVNLGGTRIRRYVIATPVEESVSLHAEKVTLDRRPVTDGRPVANADFTDKTIEMTESTEEAVVSKEARVVEEVSLRKEATDRVETVRDTVRKEEVEIEQIPGETTTARTEIHPLDPHAPKI
jgi:uncharacterized protein (TIGR02271 family)